MPCCQFPSINLKVQFIFQLKLTRWSEKQEEKKGFFFIVSSGLKAQGTDATKCLS